MNLPIVLPINRSYRFESGHATVISRLASRQKTELPTNAAPGGAEYPGFFPKIPARFGASLSNPGTLQFLNRRFETNDPQKPHYSAGEVLIHMLNGMNRYDGKPGKLAFSTDTQAYSSGFTTMLHQDLGIRSQNARRAIIQDFLQREFLLLQDKPQPSAPLTATGGSVSMDTFGNVTYGDATGAPIKQPPGPKPEKQVVLGIAAVTAAIDWTLKRHQRPPQRNSNEAIQYVTPPFDLSKFSHEAILDSRLFTEEDKKLIRDKVKISECKTDGDSQKARSWLDVLFSVPWMNETIDKNNVKAARKVFDSKFYGMEGLKKRILKQIVSRDFTKGNQGAIFILHGPPGTGKTAVAETIARVLGRNYAQVSLSGDNDAHSIKGHNFTYAGSQSGAIIRALRKAGSMNPVIQLDEIDKVAQSSQGGNPLFALMAVLDPKENKRYKDEYLGEIPVDLSRAIFICTANDMSKIPEPLRNRAIKIEFEAYLTEEKQEIMRRHLIPAQEHKYGFPPNQIQFSDAALNHIITRYTSEGGVRQLDERLTEVFQSICGELKKPKNRKEVFITPVEIDKWLTRPVDLVKVDSQKAIVGQVYGLGWNHEGIGGGITPVQTVVVKGNGELKTTGLPGDVMKESIQVALTNIMRAHQAGSIKIASDIETSLAENKLNIHIHYPTGSIPKNGPSAGTSTLVSLWSALTQTPVPTDIALTGEIDLMGNILPIGSIRGKVSRAIEQGVKRIYLPEANQKDFTELVEESEIFARMTRDIQIQFVSRTEELLKDIQQESRKVTASPQSKEGDSGLTFMDALARMNGDEDLLTPI